MVMIVLYIGATPSDQFWIGGNDLQTENVFVWAGTNDHITEFKDWSVGEPNQNGTLSRVLFPRELCDILVF